MTNILLSKKFFSLILVFVVVAMLFVGLNVSAVDQIKTTETFVGNSDTAVSSQVDKTFNLYIGDNLSGVTNPMKSVYFKVSGVYTGGAGSVALSIDGDAGTIKTFNLPIVTVPTPFEILYKDTAGKINPTSAGSYSYTLNINPSGVTIYGLGAKVVETHRYKPPSCGVFPIKGELLSAVFDSGIASGAAYNSILWKGTLAPGNTGKVRFQFATSNNIAGPWNFIGGNTCQSGDWFDPSAPNIPIELTCPTIFNNRQYFRYRVEICSDNCTSAGSASPTVHDVIINWAP